MPTVEERLERIEKILEGSGLGLLGEMELGATLSENLGMIMEPGNLRLISVLARFLEQAEALEKLADTLEKLNKSGALEILGSLSESLAENLGMLADPKVLRLLSHAGNALDFLSRIDPTAAGMMLDLGVDAAREVFTPEKLKNPPKVTVIGLLRALSDPEIEKGLGLLLELLRVVSRTFDKAKAKEAELQTMMEKMMKKGKS